MTQKISSSLRESAAARWTALGIVSFTMFCGYFLADAMSPLKPMLESQLLWDNLDYGIFTSAYGWFNVFLLMLILGGILLDKTGVRFTGILSTSIMVIGAGIKFFAISRFFPVGMGPIFGIKAQVMIAALGYATFAVGVETAGITVSRIIVKWFKGKEMALAMGLQVAFARLGTLLAVAIPLPIAKYFGDVSVPILFGALLLCIGLIAYIVYVRMDIKLEKSEAHIEKEEEEPFKLADVLSIVTNKGFWLIALLCVLFYSAVFPWIKFATDLVINKYQVNPNLAGLIPSVLPLGTLFLTPFFGNLYDKKGKGATIMIIGSVLLIFVHGIFSIPFLNNWILAMAVTVVLGVALSLVPSAMWPSVPKIIPEKQLGTAYALIFWIQNWGLMGVPLLIGVVLSATNPTVSRAKETVKAGIVETYTQLQPKLNLNKIEFDKAVDNTTTRLINQVLVNTEYTGKQDTTGFAGFKNKLVAVNLQAIQSLPAVQGKEKLGQQVEDACVKAGYNEIDKQQIALRYDYTKANLIFMIFGILAFFVAFMLKAEDRKKGYGLELPNKID
ncbi:MAG: MFS transporter [Bacteroidota bacterium]|nr:MFS transporter [Bacteroidota bacterium]